MILLKILNEKMKKVLFLMFLLFLMVLETVHVNAQVRIGGNAAPQGAAVLDLNADNTATPAANKGALALPRVSLASTTAQLNGTTPITGMLVWNTNTTVGTGVYYWSGTAWVKANLPATVPSDSGAPLMSNGTGFVVARPVIAGYRNDTLHLKSVPDTIKYWIKIVDSTFYTSLGADSAIYVHVTGLSALDMCRVTGMTYNVIANHGDNFVKVWQWKWNAIAGVPEQRLVCYRPVY